MYLILSVNYLNQIYNVTEQTNGTLVKPKTETS